MKNNTVRIGTNHSLYKERIVNISAGCYLIHHTETGIKILIIQKTWPNGKIRYVLPKGHVENGETLEEAAIRETREESGYIDISLLKYIGSNTYELDWSEIQIKTDHYFLAKLNSEKTVQIKPEDYEQEVKVEIVWKDLDEVLNLLTFENQEKIHKKLRNLIYNLFK
jgi:8-oxo-dGTP pyrophosphatase MutT (NUDIX family)